jgi:hypothetical protein
MDEFFNAWTSLQGAGAAILGRKFMHSSSPQIKRHPFPPPGLHVGEGNRHGLAAQMHSLSQAAASSDMKQSRTVLPLTKDAGRI